MAILEHFIVEEEGTGGRMADRIDRAAKVIAVIVAVLILVALIALGTVTPAVLEQHLREQLQQQQSKCLNTSSILREIHTNKCVNTTIVREVPTNKYTTIVREVPSNNCINRPIVRHVPTVWPSSETIRKCIAQHAVFVHLESFCRMLNGTPELEVRSKIDYANKKFYVEINVASDK